MYRKASKKSMSGDDDPENKSESRSKKKKDKSKRVKEENHAQGYAFQINAGTSQTRRNYTHHHLVSASAHNMGQPPPSTTLTTTTTSTAAAPPGAASTPPMYYGTVGSNGPTPGGGGAYIHHPQSYMSHGPLMGQHRPHGYNNMPPTRVPSPPSIPPIIYHSERAQRLHVKLRKKSEQNRLNKMANQPGGSMGATGYAPTGSYFTAAGSTDTPPLSPKKDNNNIRKLKDRNQNGMPDMTTTTVIVGADGSDSKDETDFLRKRITELKEPQISDVGVHGATVTWDPVEAVAVETSESNEMLNEFDISYEVVISQKGKALGQQGQFSYKSKDCCFRLADLEPGTDYWIRLSALVNGIVVQEAAAVEFRTEACRPSTPVLKLQNRTRNSLNVRWVPPLDNGSPISQYILECDDGNGMMASAVDGETFSEVYRGRNKQFTIGKLQPSTCYAIRLAACNEIGTSEWSETLMLTTMGAPPPPPAPPVLVSSSAKHISLVWDGSSSTDSVYTLQMADPTSGHGFLNAYHGQDNEYTCASLWRSTTYRFRLQTQNDDGISRWSDEISYCTLADRPVAPARPGVKGRILAHSFKVRWESPADCGGSAISQYSLELDSGNGFVLLWSGPETELVLDKLTPGTTYRVRIFCFNGQEQSDYSEPLIVTTEPVCPEAPAPPSLAGKARANSLQLKWERPDYDGGSMVTQYEVNLVNPDGSPRIVFSGYETECLVASLLPGRSYSFQVRASNRIGFGPWSDLIEIKSGPGAPESPLQPSLTHRSSHSVSLTWNEPANNGSPISEYRLEVAPNRQVSKSPSISSLSSETVEPQSEELDIENLTFSLCHSLSGRQYEVKGLQPASVYYFRLQAVNAAGSSAYSPLVSFTTLASSPAIVSGLRMTAADTSCLTLTWNVPQSNGSAITHYNIELGDKGTYCTNEPVTNFTIGSLSPDTQYRVRVQAANGIGIGPFSTAAKFSTRPLPPPAPRLECAQIGHNALKLRWGDGKNLNFLTYNVEMQEEGSERFYLLYEGSGQSYKVSKLKETTSYAFRICARNEVGEGPYSDIAVFSTTRAPPPTLKKPDVSDITETSCRITWSAQRLLLPSDYVTYQVEIIRSKEQDLVMTKRCSENELLVDDLDSRTEYSVRVCPSS